MYPSSFYLIFCTLLLPKIISFFSLPSQEGHILSSFPDFLIFGLLFLFWAVEFNIHTTHNSPIYTSYHSQSTYKMLRQSVFFSVFHCTRINPEPHQNLHYPQQLPTQSHLTHFQPLKFNLASHPSVPECAYLFLMSRFAPLLLLLEFPSTVMFDCSF